MSHEFFDFEMDEWRNTDSGEFSLTMKSSSSASSSIDKSFTLSNEIMSLVPFVEHSFSVPTCNLSKLNKAMRSEPKLQSTTSVATAAVRLEKTKPSNHRQDSKSKSVAKRTKDSARLGRRTSSHRTNVVSVSSRKNSASRKVKDSERFSRDHLAVLDIDTGMQCFRSMSHRDVFQNDDDMHSISLFTEKKPGAENHQGSIYTNETRLALNRRTFALIDPTTNDTEKPRHKKNHIIMTKDEMYQPRTRKLIRHNSFANLRRSSSSRSLARNEPCDRAKAKAIALGALVMTKTGKGQAMQCKPLSIDDSSLSDSSESFQSPRSNDSKQKRLLKVPAVHEETHPVLCVLTNDLWSDDRAIVERAVKQLVKFCQEGEQNKSTFMLAGYCPLCGVMRKWYTDKEILIACFQLMQLASERFVVGAFGCGALESIMCAMDNFATDGRLQAGACGALATIVSASKRGPSIKLAVDLNGSSALIKAMESFPDSIEVQQKASMTFFSMARFPELREYLQVGISTVVRKSMEKFATTSIAVEHVTVKGKGKVQDGMTARGA